MPFLQLTIEVGRTDPTPFEEALFERGALSVTLEDAADDPILEPAPGATPLWPTVRVKALFTAELHEAAARELAEELAPECPYSIEHIGDRAWEREWLKDFRPMRFGGRLWVCPAGQRPEQTDAVIVDLDPGLAFGTGTHATTALCLQWLDGQSLSAAHVIDYGCGSGILAIAALKLGANSAVGIDNDPQALLASRDNALRNGVSERLILGEPSMPITAQADILLANILAQPLHMLAEMFAGLVKPSGTIVLSGVLTDQIAVLESRYAQWFDMQPSVAVEGWSRLVGIRRLT